LKSRPLLWCHPSTHAPLESLLKQHFDPAGYKRFADVVFWPSVQICDSRDFPNALIFATNCTNADHLHCPEEKKVYFRNSDLLRDVWATAEHTIALLLQACRTSNDRQMYRRELHGQPIKIYGDGRIARQVQQLLLPFELRLVEHASAAQVTLICTRSLAAEDFQLGNCSGILVNTSRGNVFPGADGRRVADWLDKSSERVYATDFRPRDPRLRDHPRCLWTDHLGGYTRESTLKTQRIVLDLLLEVVKNL